MEIIAWVTEVVSIKGIRRFAFLLRLAVQGTPSLACPFAGKIPALRSPCFAGARPCAICGLGARQLMLHWSFVFTYLAHRTFFSIWLTLDHLGEPTTPPPIAPARGPPPWEDDIDQTPLYDPTLAQSAPDYEFDQCVGW